MSHVSQVDVKFTNVKAIQAVCTRLNANFCGKGFVTFYDGTEVGGNIVHLPGWQYAMVITPDGTLKYDNYEGEWGNTQDIDRFKQLYAIEAAKVKAEEQGYTYQEEELPTGVLKLTISI